LTEYHLILGGCGFIGRHVAVLLAREGHHVILADRTPPAFNFPGDVTPRISWKPFELASGDWDVLVENAAVIHHYIWTSLPASANGDPAGDLNTNVVATVALLEALRRRGNGRVVFASSGGTVYGKLQQIPVPEEHPLAPITAYGAGKATAELYLGLYRSLYKLDCRIARIANPYGAGQNLSRGQGAATTFLHKALTRQPITLWGDGEVIRDYIHITDVASAMVALALAPRNNDAFTFNIGNGRGVSLNDIIVELQLQLNTTLEVRREPGRPFDVPVSVLDISRARDILGWSPRLSFREGMARTMRDLARQAGVSDLEYARAVASGA
jgi:UDP-glucose 4-epimerase